MKFAVDLSKGVLGNADSTELWTEIISNIPDSVLLTPNVRILSVACGHCTEAVILAKRMLALGISKESVGNSIWVTDKYKVFTNHAKFAYGFTNVITADFLEWETDMKFDVIVGNPPYQSTEDGSKRKKMWVQFANKAIAMADIVAFVTPTAWQKENSKYFKEVADKIQSHLIAYNGANDYFSVGEDIGYWVVDKNSTNNIPIIDNNPCTPIYNKMLKSKGTSWHYRDFQQPHVVDNGTRLVFTSTPTSVANVPIYWTAKQIRYCRKQDVKYTGWKVIVNNSGHYYDSTNPDKYSKVDNSMTVGLGAWGIKVASEAEGVNVLSWVRSKLYRVVVTQMKTGGFNNPFIELQFLGTTKHWTDAEIYAHFNLTDEEIAYVESNVK